MNMAILISVLGNSTEQLQVEDCYNHDTVF
jgi:hypothetical protein